MAKVSETEREDLEESEKVQHWVERLCQTRLEQISSVENESPEVKFQLFHILHDLQITESCLLKAMGFTSERFIFVFPPHPL